MTLYSSLYMQNRRHGPTTVVDLSQSKPGLDAQHQAIKMKTRSIRRALVLANVFNLTVAIYFVVIGIVSLVQLRWYLGLTIAVRVRPIIVAVTSYFAFVVLLFEGLVLMTIFVVNAASLSCQRRMQVELELGLPTQTSHLSKLISTNTADGDTSQQQQQQQQQQQMCQRPEGAATGPPRRQQRFDEGRSPGVMGNKQAGSMEVALEPTSSSCPSAVPRPSGSSACCMVLLHLICAVCLVVILIVWLLNTGEIVRDNISSQLEAALARYQFSNKSSHYTNAIDGIQDINNCCGSFEYTDFPHQRHSGLSNGHYPGSCCGKNIYVGANARVICTPEEIVRAKQTTGCTTVLANYYDLVSLLVVPVALACLFVNIAIIALVTISRGYTLASASTAAVTGDENVRSSGQRPIQPSASSGPQNSL